MRRSLAMCAVLLSSCATTPTDDEKTSSTHQAVIGDPLPGVDPEEFEEAAETFAAEEEIDEGLGPTFNEKGCGTCHDTPVLGGSGINIERRFGRITNGTFFGYDGPPENRGGTLRQLFSNGTYVNNGVTCNIVLDAEPTSANVRNVGRRTTPLFGLGLVDAMPDSWFDHLAAQQPVAIRGIANRVRVVLPDPRDPTQSIGSTRVARFGHKAGVPGLMQFSADAYVNEMGITTQSCFRGTSIKDFAFENHPNNVPPPAGCNGGDLAPANTGNDPDVPEFADDVVGSCADNRTEIQDDVIEFTTFMESLAPPEIDTSDPIGFTLGAVEFSKAGCNGCHVLTPFVTPAHPFNGVPGNRVFLPFSDFLVHDMGALGDRIGNTGDSEATTRLMRTAPLWGARHNAQFLHDGRAKSIRAAILAHAGQGAAARQAFIDAGLIRQLLLVRFVNAL